MHPIKTFLRLSVPPGPVACLLSVLLTALLSSCASSSTDDSRNEVLAQKRIKNAHAELEDAPINVTSFNGIVLITGQVSKPELIPLVTERVEALRNAKKVYNELTLAEPGSFLSRTNDSVLSARIKLKLASNKDTDASRIRVVTENGVVYLMGRVTSAEAEAAVEAARQVYGVQKIVKVFEYSDS